MIDDDEGDSSPSDAPAPPDLLLLATFIIIPLASLGPPAPPADVAVVDVLRRLVGLLFEPIPTPRLALEPRLALLLLFLFDLEEDVGPPPLGRDPAAADDDAAIITGDDMEPPPLAVVDVVSLFPPTP